MSSQMRDTVLRWAQRLLGAGDPRALLLRVACCCAALDGSLVACAVTTILNNFNGAFTRCSGQCVRVEVTSPSRAAHSSTVHVASKQTREAPLETLVDIHELFDAVSHATNDVHAASLASRPTRETTATAVLGSA